MLFRKWSIFWVIGVTLLCGSVTARAQDVMQLLRTAVSTELAASKTDKSLWRYRDDAEVKRTVSIVVQTRSGSVSRLIGRGGRPLPPEEAKAEEQRLQDLVHNSAKMAKQRKDSETDDKSATELLQMLPEAFTWKFAGEDAGTVTLAFAPNPEFRPPDMQARVLGMMAGVLVVDKGQHRIATISGKLTQDVNIGFGLLGKLKEGGTFRVERRQVAPRLWQVTETHVHIDGKALLFKAIGQDQDEIQTEFTPVPEGTTMDEAVEMSKPRR